MVRRLTPPATDPLLDAVHGGGVLAGAMVAMAVLRAAGHGQARVKAGGAGLVAGLLGIYFGHEAETAFITTVLPGVLPSLLHPGAWR